MCQPLANISNEKRKTFAWSAGILQVAQFIASSTGKNAPSGSTMSGRSNNAIFASMPAAGMNLLVMERGFIAVRTALIKLIHRITELKNTCVTGVSERLLCAANAALPKHLRGLPIPMGINIFGANLVLMNEHQTKG